MEILGLLEARLLTFDRVVLGALDETVWPLATDPGPWMSRPMRQEFGLPEPEARIGRVCADFLLAACSAPERRAVARRPARRRADRAGPLADPASRPSCAASRMRRCRAASACRSRRWSPGPPRWTCPAAVTPCDRPAPRPPPAALRPREISVTEVDTLLADPYAFYARRMLGLRPLDPIDAEAGAADYGNLVHATMARFITALGDGKWPGREAAAALFDAAAEAALAEAGARPGLTAFWRPRLARIGGFVAGRGGRGARATAASAAPPPRSPAASPWPAPATRPSRCGARADRIDVLADGTLGILDYKTGTPPTGPKIAGGDAPQSPLEAAMAARGGFPGLDAAATTALLYWKLSGGAEPGEVIDAGSLLARHRKAASPAAIEARRRSLPGGPPAGRRLPAGQQAVPRLAAPVPRHRRARLRPSVAPRRMGRRRGRRRRMTDPCCRAASAERAQRIASDPGLSAWVGASAGSGKTKVLTDRVLRLLLQEGQAPTGCCA